MNGFEFRGCLLLTVQQTADLVNASTKTIYRAIERGDLRCTNIGASKGIRLSREAVEEWISLCTDDGDRTPNGIEIEHPVTPPKTAKRGPYAREKTPRRGTLK